MTELDNLKCCGNCKYNGSIDNGGYLREENCRIGGISDSSKNVCENWVWDQLTHKDRMI
jgi:hypothetical protein